RICVAVAFGRRRRARALLPSLTPDIERTGLRRRWRRHDAACNVEVDELIVGQRRNRADLTLSAIAERAAAVDSTERAADDVDLQIVCANDEIVAATCAAERIEPLVPRQVSERASAPEVQVRRERHVAE